MIAVMKIFFDVDGVLVDGWHDNPELRKPWSASIEVDLGVDLAEFEKQFFVTKRSELGSLMDACVGGHRDLKEALTEVLPHVGYTGNVDDFVRYWFEKDSNVSNEVFDLVDTLQSIPGMELFIATGQEHHRAAYLWNELEFSKHFTDMFYSADLGFLKSDIRFYESINARLGITAGGQSLFFDDREDVVKTARLSGWDAAAFNSAADIRSHPRLSHLF